jgi:hypothetical protein
MSITPDVPARDQFLQHPKEIQRILDQIAVEQPEDTMESALCLALAVVEHFKDTVQEEKEVVGSQITRIYERACRDVANYKDKVEAKLFLDSFRFYLRWMQEIVEIADGTSALSLEEKAKSFARFRRVCKDEEKFSELLQRAKWSQGEDVNGFVHLFEQAVANARVRKRAASTKGKSGAQETPTTDSSQGSQRDPEQGSTYQAEETTSAEDQESQEHEEEMPDPDTTSHNPSYYRIPTAKDLIEVVEPREWLIANFLAKKSASLLAAAKSVGKSVFAVDMAVALTEGMPFLGFPTRKSRVLYLALDMARETFADRLRDLKKPITLLTEISVITQKEWEDVSTIIGTKDSLAILVYLLESAVAEGRQYDLAIVDTLANIYTTKGPNQYGQEYKFGDRLKSTISRFSVAAFLLHHTNQRVNPRMDPNWMHAVSGTTGLIGGLNDIMLLDKKKLEDREAVLFVGGQNIEMQTIPVRFNPEVIKWEGADLALENRNSKLLNALLSCRNKVKNGYLDAKDVADLMNQGKTDNERLSSRLIINTLEQLGVEVRRAKLNNKPVKFVFDEPRLLALIEREEQHKD